METTLSSGNERLSTQNIPRISITSPKSDGEIKDSIKGDKFPEIAGRRKSPTHEFGSP